jgi:hypothetical protein
MSSDYNEDEELRKALEESIKYENERKIALEMDQEIDHAFLNENDLMVEGGEYPDDIYLNAAIEMSLKNDTQSDFSGNIEDEDDELEAALNLSISDYHNLKEAHSDPPNGMIIEPNMVPLVKSLTNHFSKIFYMPIRIQRNVLKFESSSTDLVEVAKAEIRSKLSDELQFQNLADEVHNTLIRVYVDYSNIFFGSQTVLSPEGKYIRDLSIRIKINRLHSLIIGDRNAEETVVFGSDLPGLALVWNIWRDLGFKVHTQVGVKQDMVDDALIAQMQLGILKYSHPPATQRTLVLLTGDGNDNHGRATFPSVLEGAIGAGWKVELWSWRQSINKRYEDFYNSYSSEDVFKIHYLDTYREYLVYNIDLNSSKTINHTDHPSSSKHDLHGHSGKKSAHKSTQNISSKNQTLETTSNHSSRERDKKRRIKKDKVKEVKNDFVEDQTDFVCPLTLQNIDSNDAARSKYSERHFQAKALKKFIRSHRQCPVSRMPMTEADIRPADPGFIFRMNSLRKGNGLN